MFEVGSLVDLKYQVGGLCSNAGGMGTVLFVHHFQQPNVPLVLKYCKHTDEDTLRRFRREVRVMQDFKDSTEVVPVLDANPNHVPPYFVMPYFEHGDVAKHAENIRSDVSLTEQYFIRMIDCIEQLHMRGVFHRDIKPQNFLIGHGRLVVSDLGLCTQPESSTVFTHSSDFGGTPGYMPPEFFNGGFRHANASTDIYMLGATFRNIVCGSSDPGAFNHLNPAMRVVLERACSPDPAKRYASLAELRQSLKSVFDVMLNRASGQLSVLEFKLRIVDRWASSRHADGNEISAFIDALLVLPGQDQETICFDLLRDMFEALASGPVPAGQLSRFLESYRAMAEHGSYGWSYAEVIADNCAILFFSPFVSDEDKVDALRIAVIAADRQNRFAAMDTCKRMIVSVDSIGLGQRVYDLMVQHKHSFMQNIDPASCKAFAVRQAIAQIKAEAAGSNDESEGGNPFEW